MDPERVADRTTVGLFLRQAARLGDRTAVRHHDGSGWRGVSWTGLRDRTLRTAACLVGAGVRAGDRVVLMSENRLEWISCDLAIQAVGAITVPIYASTPPGAAQVIAEDAGATLGFVADDLAGRLRLDRLVRLDADLPGWVGDEADPELMDAVEARMAALRPDDVATIVYTSGTTGVPKGVMLAHRSFVDMARSCLEVFDIGPDDESLSFLPYAHVFERINGVFVGLAAGGSTWLSRGVPRLVDDLGECRPTVMVAVPRVYEKMHQQVMALVRQAPGRRRAIFGWALEQGRRRSQGRAAPLHFLADRIVLGPIRRRLTGGRLRFFVSGGAPLSAEVEGFFWALGVQIYNGWGMTETASGATSNRPGRHRFETVGPPLPGVELRIAEDGEILVSSPGNMLGYYRNPAASAETLDDGWVLTGDIGEVDADGFLRITDRKKELIKTAGGKFVAPAQLEARLMKAPIIERAIVVGDERPYVVALIVPDWQALEAIEGVSGSPEQLLQDERARAAVQRCVDDLNRDLGSWETVKYFELLAQDLTEELDELTPTLKVKRRVVGQRYRGVIDRMYQDRTRPEATHRG
ncbi:MAG TPA: AMP-dependent synthetase/ligase [Candidatus Dormibacteraeota bacterium]|nr:AMP-dependent synthetase/ligase [Candidatus Dormibacteraeota bacterium]